MLWEVLHAIPGQASSRHASTHVFEHGTDEGPHAPQSAYHLDVEAHARTSFAREGHWIST
eukprot:2293175-Pyramimonas_sp.AAC.1